MGESNNTVTYITIACIKTLENSKVTYYKHLYHQKPYMKTVNKNALLYENC